MSVLTQFGGGRGPVTSIVNGGSDGATSFNLAAVNLNAKGLASGALTSATLATALSITGRGVLNWASVETVDTTSRTVRITVTIDGTEVFDATSSTITSAARGLIAVGSLSGAYQPIEFTTSCLVQIASSLTETDKLTTRVAYEVWA